MRTRGWVEVVALATTLALAARPRPAAACSGDDCRPGYLVPADGATVPANLPAVVWEPRPSPAAPDPGVVQLVTAAAPSTAIPLAASGGGGGALELSLGGPLDPGAAYALVDATTVAGTCPPPLRATFTAAAAAPLPTRLGATVLEQVTRGEVTQPTTAGSCWVTAQADRAHVRIALAPEAEPWRDVLLYETIVDGGPWAPRASLRSSYPPGASWQGRGVDLVFHACPNDVGITGVSAIGLHTIEFTARIPGTATVLRSDPVQVALPCAAAEDAGSAVGADERGGCAAGGGGIGAAAAGLLAAAMLRRRARRYDDISRTASTPIATISTPTST
ncbi:MAG: hypothetical protein JNK64_32245 [Myxococcales bacterium]|nr:hypothetical protein [Myxococcales bacterium]